MASKKDILSDLYDEIEEHKKRYERLLRDYNEVIRENKELKSNSSAVNSAEINKLELTIKNQNIQIEMLKSKNKELKRGIYRAIVEMCKGYEYDTELDEIGNQIKLQENFDIANTINKIQFDTGEDMIELST